MTAKNKYLDNKLVFLAGATGLAGSSILQHIIADYPKTKIRATYFNTEPFIKHEKIEYVGCDLKSERDCRRFVKGCDCAIMAAAYTGGAGFVTSNQWAHIMENLIMNIQMLEAFQKEQIKRIVYVGSATLYQEFEGSISEDELDLNKDPSAAYFGFGWTVRFIEKLCNFLHNQYGMEIIIARVSNIFGPFAKFDLETSNFIPAIIRKAVDKMDPFEVWGSPNVTRDVIYSDDFARSILLMLSSDDIKFDIFNIGSGTKVTVGDVVRLALKYAGHKPREVKYDIGKPTTVKFRAIDCSKAKKVIGWKPQYTIEEGIKKTSEWWIENKGWWKK